ncbi:hypothetical protein MLD38_015633 [Melastoma candidum]|uniref:Uncharacterized protein n=1 Tax=Melastoma candidum TaxID=119954 RepID=A0ACB9RGU2_9MYRT|nr:hypothetical protein MLD38_015633 [Melastoma candidum]
MNCFSCFQCNGGAEEEEGSSPHAEQDNKKQKAGGDVKPKQIEQANIPSQHYTFRELASATKNFRQECLLGEGGFGRVYKGTLAGTGQVVAVKQLDRHGLQGNQEFLTEVMALSQLHHENLVELVGYCADGEQRLLVFEYLSGGSLVDHLFDIGEDKKPLDWLARMRIAFSAAQGLEYLHDKADPPVIYRDFKTSNILMDSDGNPKLSDFGLAKLGPSNDKMHVSSRVMGTYGYCAPEYARTNTLTVKSDIYSFGVVLLELITGRKAIDNKRPTQEQNLVTWAQPKFRDPKSFPDLADPLLERKFPEKGLNQAVAIAAMCLQEEASVRPLIADVVATLGFLMMAQPEPVSAPIPESMPSQKEGRNSKKHPNNGNETGTDSHSSSDSDAEENSRSKHDLRSASKAEEGKDDSSDDDEEEADFKNLAAEDKEYDSGGSSSMISFSVGGSLLSRDKSSVSRVQSTSANRQVSVALSEQSISSRRGSGREWSQKSSKKSKRESGRLSPRGSISSSSRRSNSDISQDDVDLITPRGSITSLGRKSSKKFHFGSSKKLSSRDHSSVFRRGSSSVKSHDGPYSSPRSSVEHQGHDHGHYFGDANEEGSEGSSSDEEEVHD